VDEDAKAVGFDRESHGIDRVAGIRRPDRSVPAHAQPNRADEEGSGKRISNGQPPSITTANTHTFTVVIRGVRDNGEALRLSRGYVQQGIRSIAADLCTRQLGYRTELDGVEAERCEITEKRFTSIDKRLPRDAPEFTSDHFTIVRNSTQPGLSYFPAQK
jgi:type IV secretory pathway VirD2 relaxase